MPPSSEDKALAALAHGLGLLGWGLGLGHILGPLIVWLIKKDSSPYVAAHALEALNFHLSLTIYVLCMWVMCFTIILIPFVYAGFLAIAALSVIAAIMAVVKAASGEPFTYPLNLRLVK